MARVMIWTGLWLEWLFCLIAPMVMSFADHDKGIAALALVGIPILWFQRND